MEKSAIVISKEEAEEFGEFKRQKRLTLARRQIAMLCAQATSPTATLRAIKEYCENAKRLNLCAVTVNPIYVRSAKSFIADSRVGVISVGGGSEQDDKLKYIELKRALFQGADEVIYNLSVSQIKNGNFASMKRYLKKAVKKARTKSVGVRVEKQLLTEAELKSAFIACYSVGVRTFWLSYDVLLISKIRAFLPKDCAIKSAAINADEYRTLLGLGVCSAATLYADEIASALIDEASSLGEGGNVGGAKQNVEKSIQPDCSDKKAADDRSASGEV